MRKRNLLIFTLVVVLMTAMSAPVFAGSQGDRPEHKKLIRIRSMRQKKAPFRWIPAFGFGKTGRMFGSG